MLGFDRGLGYAEKGEGNGILDTGNGLARIARSQAAFGGSESVERQPGRLDLMPSEGLAVCILLQGRLRVRPYNCRCPGLG